MAGGFHSTLPSEKRVALVAKVTSKLPSALERKIEINKRCDHVQGTNAFRLLRVQESRSSSQPLSVLNGEKKLTLKA